MSIVIESSISNLPPSDTFPQAVYRSVEEFFPEEVNQDGVIFRVQDQILVSVKGAMCLVTMKDRVFEFKGLPVFREGATPDAPDYIKVNRVDKPNHLVEGWGLDNITGLQPIIDGDAQEKIRKNDTSGNSGTKQTTGTENMLSNTNRPDINEPINNTNGTNGNTQQNTIGNSSNPAANKANNSSESGPTSTKDWYESWTYENWQNPVDTGAPEPAAPGREDVDNYSAKVQPNLDIVYKLARDVVTAEDYAIMEIVKDSVTNVFIDENQKVFITLIGDDNKEYTGLVSKGKLVFKDEDWAKLSDFKRYKL